MVHQSQVNTKIYKAVVDGLAQDGQYSFDIKPFRENLEAFKVGNTIRLMECIEETINPISIAKDKKLTKTEHTRVLHRPTGKEIRLVVISLENSVSPGYKKVTVKEEE